MTHATGKVSKDRLVIRKMTREANVGEVNVVAPIWMTFYDR